MRDESAVWNFYAPVYNLFMRQNRAAYMEMYEKIKTAARGKRVLEAATGTGLIAKHIAETTREIVAVDFADKMLSVAQKGKIPCNLHFQKADATALPFADASFDVAVISNALHIIPHPEKALSELWRVLTPDGILIAPNFIHKKGGSASGFLSKALSAAGIVFDAKWDRESYAAFLEENGWIARESCILKATIPLMYTECVKNGSGNEGKS